MFGAGLEIEPYLPRERIEHGTLCDHPIGCIARKSRQRQVITQTARVMEQPPIVMRAAWSGNSGT